MKLKARYLIFLLLMSGVAVSFFSGCATTAKHAREAMEAGDYEDAMRLYEQAIHESPDDIDAQKGLKSARERYLSKRLIEVRQARMDGDSLEALKILLDTINKETDWQTPVGGAVAVTQDDETDFALDYATKEINRDVSKRHPLKAEAFLNEYAPVFQGRTLSQFSALKDEVHEAGRDSCHAFRKLKLKGKVHFAAFISRFCQHWGVDARVLAERAPVSRIFFGRVKTTFKQDSLTPEFRVALGAKLEEALKRTAWYDPGSDRTLDVTLSGQSHTTHTKDAVFLTQEYQVEEPYTEIVSVQKEREVPYTDYQTVVDPKTGATQSLPVTKYRSESYWTEEPETRYRSVTHEYRYPAFKHSQTLSITLVGSFQLNGRDVGLSYNDESSADGIEHDENRPSMGLRPSRPNLPDPDAWYRGEFAKFASRFEQKAVSQWQDQYCKEPGAGVSESQLGEEVFKCLRQKNLTPPSFAEQWYLENLGLSVADSESALKAI